MHSERSRHFAVALAAVAFMALAGACGGTTTTSREVASTGMDPLAATLRSYRGDRIVANVLRRIRETRGA